MTVRFRITVAAIAILALVALAMPASAGTKQCEGTGTLVGLPAQSTLSLDDVAQHRVNLNYAVWSMMSTCAEFDQSRQLVRAYHDLVAGSGTGIGYFTIVTKEGDRAFGKYSSTYKMEMRQAGSWEQLFTIDWAIYDGTGKCEGMTGKGTASGKSTPEGSTYDWQGEFVLP